MEISLYNQSRTPTIGDSVATKDFYDVIRNLPNYDKSWCASANRMLDVTRIRQVKTHLPKIYPFISSTETFTGSNVDEYSSDGVVLIDIDDTTATSVFFNDSTIYDSFNNVDSHSTFREIQKQCPWIIAAWESFSGKLHVAVYDVRLNDLHGEELKTAYTKSYRLHSAALFLAMYIASNETYLATRNKDAYDEHGEHIYQGMFLNYVSKEHLYINKNPSASWLSEDAYNDLFPEMFADLTKKNSNAKYYCDNVEGMFDAQPLHQGKIRVDKNYKLYYELGNTVLSSEGNTARFQIASSLWSMFGYENSKQLIPTLFERQTSNEILSALSSIDSAKRRGDNLYPSHVSIETYIKYVLVDMFNADESYVLQSGQYVSDYAEQILNQLTNHNVYIKAGCGTGKSSFFRKIFRESKKVIIVTHLNSIRDGVYNTKNITSSEKFNLVDNIIETGSEEFDYSKFILSTAQVCNLIKNREMLPDRMIINWNSYAEICKSNEYRMMTSEYIKLIDEAHNFIQHIGFRMSVIADIVKYNDMNKTIFCSATPLGEQNIFNRLYKMEFKKERDSIINYYFLRPLDEQKIQDVDYLTTMVDYIYRHQSAYDTIAVFDNHKHTELADAFKGNCLHLCREQKETEDYINSESDKSISNLFDSSSLKSKILISTIYGTQGIEIKNQIDKLLVICPMRDLLYSDVEQFLNRFRNVRQVDVIIMMTEYVQRTYYTEFIKQLDCVLSKQDVNTWNKVENHALCNLINYDNTKITAETISLIKYILTYHNMRNQDTINTQSIYNMFQHRAQTVKIRYFTNQIDKISKHSDVIDRLMNDHPKLFGTRKFNSIYEVEDIYQNYEDDKWWSDVDLKAGMQINNKYMQIKQMCSTVMYVKCDGKNCFIHYGDITNEKLYDNIIRLFHYGDKFHLDTAYRFMKSREDAIKEVFLGTEFTKYSDANPSKCYYSTISRWNLKPDDAVKNCSDRQTTLCSMLESVSGVDNKGRSCKDLKLKYSLLNEPARKFRLKDEAYRFLVENNLTKVSFETFNKKTWKNFLMKI